MCRNIKPLFNFDPPATDTEISDAALQFVRTLSGFQKPSQMNEKAFNRAVAKVSRDTQELLESLTTTAEKRNREKESKRAKERSALRFGVK